MSGNLLFIHGFLGDSEKSEKYNFIKNYCQIHGLGVIPFELNYDETDFERVLNTKAIGAVGVSLGGLFARYFNIKHNSPCLSINSRFDLTNFVNAGTYKKYNTDESVVISKEFLDQLAEINRIVNVKKSVNQTIVLSREDDQVDYEQNLQSYLTIVPQENIKSVAKESHRITLPAFEAVFIEWYNESYLACEHQNNKSINLEKNCYVKHSYNDSSVFEMRLNSVWQHGKDGFIMMSAFKWENTFEQNLEQHQLLKKDLRENNLKFAEIDGSCQDSVTNEVSDELSVFIPFNSKKYTKEDFSARARELCKKYNQDSVLYMMDEIAMYYSSDDKTPDKKIDTKISFDKHANITDDETGEKICEIYSKMRKCSHAKYRKTDACGKTQCTIHYVVEGCRRPCNIMAIRGFEQIWSGQYS